jgi:thioredoxin-related protein
MSKLSHKAELAANILIIVAAALLIGVIVEKYFFSKPAINQQARVQPVIGSHMNLLDENRANQSKTLILALQTGCHFCNESAPFYKRLIEAVKDKNVKLIAVFPTSIEESKAHLNELGLTNLEVRRSPLENIQVSGTPTLILTNETGEIMDFWLGKLTPDKEAEVINKLSS